MISVMVVDDENLVRKGIMTTFPWRKHGFEVTCDAGSGEKALELLEREPVDLLVTDLAMNGMSGLELIRIVRERRRELPVVILTCHDNFKYIQEAMRLGVLDYIVKTEIEDEAVDETLKRIADKLGALGERRRGAGSEPASGAEMEGLLLSGPIRSSFPMEILDEGDPGPWVARMSEVDAATWLLRLPPDEADRLVTQRAAAWKERGWTCLRITGWGALPEEELMTGLKRYRRSVMFYAPPVSAARLAWDELAAAVPAQRERVADLRAEWVRPEWVYEVERFERLLRRTAEASLDPADLRNLFYPIALEWERLLETGSVKSLLDSADEWLYWRDWERWLRGFRAAIRAIELVRTRLDSEISEADIAAAVNMSRGHFSKSFKKVTGTSYGEYVRSLKLERAKEMILRTDEPITRVAERCGFSDYRHFSRVFREYAGMLPTEYRKSVAGEPASAHPVK
jgi:two-component system response regulator YesN